MKVANCTMNMNVFPNIDSFFQDFDLIIYLDFKFCEDEL